MVTTKDIKRVAEIADRLRKLGVPEDTCKRIDIWNKKREEVLARLTMHKERL